MDKNIRGNKCNLIITNCYDIENKEWSMVELDMREPIDRYIPEYMFEIYKNNLNNEIT